MAKFEFYDGNRIIATEDIPVHGVKKGDLGGLVYGNISRILINPKTGEESYIGNEEDFDIDKYFFDNAWIDKGAIVFNTRMSENSIIRKHTKVMNSSLSGNSQIIGVDKREEAFGKQDRSIIEDCHLSKDAIIKGYNKISGMKITGDSVAEFVFSYGLSFQEYASLHYRTVGIEETIEGDLYRIQATEDLPHIGVKKGDLGGLVSSASNSVLSTPSLLEKSWIDYEVKLIDSSLSENSHVTGEAIIKDSTIINSLIDGRITFSNSRVVSSSITLHGSGRMTYNKEKIENLCRIDHFQEHEN